MKVLFSGLLCFLACSRREPTPPPGDDTSRRPASVLDAALEGFDGGLGTWLDARTPRSPPPPPRKRLARRGDCSSEYAPRPERDPNPMCKVTGGVFAFGPENRQVSVDDFYIDQFEVTAGQVAMFLNARGSNLCPGLDRRDPSMGPNKCTLEAELESSALMLQDGSYVAKPGFEGTAAMWFSWQGALEYCAWVGKQVPSSAQWEYAARHDPHTGKDYRYPWGDEWRPNHASCWQATECKAPPAPRFGRSWSGLFDGTKGRGDGSSPWGVHDMVAGSSELVFECTDPNATCSLDERCQCRPLMIVSDAPTIAELEVMRRTEHADAGVQGLRCARTAVRPRR